jgi:hypothetical protein
MAISGNLNVTFPNSSNSRDTTPAEKLALVIEEFTGMVEGTIERRSVLENHIPSRSVKGTATFTNHAVGKSTLQKVVPGVALDGVKSDFAKNSVTVDTIVAAREFFSLLETFQTQYDVRREVATEQGKEIAKFRDQTHLIMAIKAARLTQSSFSQGAAGKPSGHFGGSLETLANAAAALDPALLYAALGKLLVQFEQKDVDPRNDDVIIVVKPEHYNTLIQAEQLINTQYVTSTGNKVNDGWVLKTYGVPVFASNNLPSTVITGHQYSNAFNSNAYDGDFSKVVAAVFSPRAIMSGETIPVTSDVFYDKMFKSWVVDSHLAFGVGPNRAEYAGTIELLA